MVESSVLDTKSRDILSFRPNIIFVEPDSEPGSINPVSDERLTFEDLQKSRDRIKQFAKAINVMAAAIQARADERAKGMVIKLDPDVDQDAIQAMRRKFPDKDPTIIPYNIYRSVKNDIRNKGIEIGRQGIIQPEEVQKARDELNASGSHFIPGGFGTDLANNGGLRPELDSRVQIIPPINIEQMQIDLICILVNFIWKNFVKPTMSGLPFPVGGAMQALPDKLCDPGGGIEIPGLFVLGEKPDDLLTGKIAAEAIKEAGL